jgi:hypothetical protein
VHRLLLQERRRRPGGAAGAAQHSPRCPVCARGQVRTARSTRVRTCCTCARGTRSARAPGSTTTRARAPDSAPEVSARFRSSRSRGMTVSCWPVRQQHVQAPEPSGVAAAGRLPHGNAPARAGAAEPNRPGSAKRAGRRPCVAASEKPSAGTPGAAHCRQSQCRSRRARVGRQLDASDGVAAGVASCQAEARARHSSGQRALAGRPAARRRKGCPPPDRQRRLLTRSAPREPPRRPAVRRRCLRAGVRHSCEPASAREATAHAGGRRAAGVPLRVCPWRIVIAGRTRSDRVASRAALGTRRGAHAVGLVRGTRRRLERLLVEAGRPPRSPRPRDSDVDAVAARCSVEAPDTAVV